MRRSTFGDFTSAFRVAPAPSIPAAAPRPPSELAYQTAQSKLPLPAFPGRVQSPPGQQPGGRQTVG